MYRFVALTLLLSLMVGCAGNVPKKIRSAPAGNPDLTAVQEDFARFDGQPVRWGGTIVKVRNFADDSEAVILAQPLNSWGEPIANAKSQGRFIARFDAFVDPAEYAAERSLTVYGVLRRVERRMIDEFPYAYPVVEVRDRHLWPKPMPGDRDPYWTWGLHDRWGHRDQVIIIREPTEK